MSNQPLVLIVGVGPATGTALCREIGQSYRLILVARSKQRIEALSKELPDATPYQCDIADESAWRRTLQTIVERHGMPSRVLINTESAAWGPYNELDLAQLKVSFDVNAVALLNTVQTLFPDKNEIPEDTRLIISSSPAAYDPPASFLGLAPSRVAQRVMAELLDELLRPYGLQFSVFSIDGVIDEPKMRQMMPNQPDSYFIQPSDIADTLAELFEVDSLPLRTLITGESSFAKN